MSPEWRGRAWPFRRCWGELQDIAAEVTGGMGTLIVVPPYGVIEKYLERLGFTLGVGGGCHVLRFEGKHG